MHKALKASCISASLIFSPLTVAGDYEKYCPENLSDPGTLVVCSVAREINVPPLKVGAAMVLASLQMTGTYCDFKFTRKFLNGRMAAENDLEVKGAVHYLIGRYRDKPPPGYNGDKRVFCKMQYESFGPRSDSPIFR